MEVMKHLIITPEETLLDGKRISASNITSLYREFAGDYPKFFKMDSLCKLGFVGAEIILRGLLPEEKENMAVILFNRNSSLITDRNYQKTIEDRDNYFPSPSLFVYTLANIVTGEIAIRHKIYGETSFYVLDNKEEDMMNEIVEGVFITSNPSSILTGWVNYDNEHEYLADLSIVRIS